MVYTFRIPPFKNSNEGYGKDRSGMILKNGICVISPLKSGADVKVEVMDGDVITFVKFFRGIEDGRQEFKVSKNQEKRYHKFKFM